jgi:hypothetical protein
MAAELARAVSAASGNMGVLRKNAFMKLVDIQERYGNQPYSSSKPGSKHPGTTTPKSPTSC